MTNGQADAEAAAAPPRISLRGTGILRGHRWEVYHVQFSPDGTRLVAGSDRGPICVWHVPEQRLLHMLHTTPSTACNVAFSPDGQVLAVACADETVRLYSADGKLTAALQGHTRGATGVAFSPAAPILATADATGQVRLWERGVWQMCTAFAAVPAEVRAPIKIPGSQDAHRRKQARRKARRAEGERLHLYDLAFSPDGTRLAMCAESPRGRVQVWQIGAPGAEARWLGALVDPIVSRPVRGVRFSPDGRFLAVHLSDFRTSEVWLFQMPALTPAQRVTVPAPDGSIEVVMDLTWSPDGRFLALVDMEGRLWCWGVEQHAMVASFAVHPDPGDVQVFAAQSVEWAAVGGLIATGGWQPFSYVSISGNDITNDLVVKLWAVQVCG